MLVEITVLGCWGPYPPAGGACSGYLVNSGDINVLLDCGHGVFSALQRYLDFRKLDAVVLSHLHPDHCADIHCLRHAIAYALRTGSKSDKLKVYLPFAPQPDFLALEKSQDAFELIDLEALSQFQWTVGVSPFPDPAPHRHLWFCGLGRRKKIRIYFRYSMV